MTPRILLPVAFLAAALSGCGSSSSDAAAGQRAQLESMRASHVVVEISASNRVRVDMERFSPKELPDVLKNKGRVYRARPVLLIVQKDTHPDAIAFVRNHAAEAGLGSVTVMTAE